MSHFGYYCCYCSANSFVSVERQISFSFVFVVDCRTTRAPHSFSDPISPRWQRSFHRMVEVGRQNKLRANAFQALRWKSFFLKKGFDIDYNKLWIWLKNVGMKINRNKHNKPKTKKHKFTNRYSDEKTFFFICYLGANHTSTQNKSRKSQTKNQTMKSKNMKRMWWTKIR